MAKKTPLAETAKRIDAHLKRFEKDISINRNTKPDRSGLADYYGAGAGVSGRYVWVKYITYQNASHLTRADAEAFLAKLDAGWVVKHWEALRKL